MELGTAQGAGLSKWPGTYKVSLVQWGSPVAPLDGAEPAHARRVGRSVLRAGAAQVSQASAARVGFQ